MYRAYPLLTPSTTCIIRVLLPLSLFLPRASSSCSFSSWRSLVYRTARMPRRNAAYIKNENEGGARISDLMAQNNVPHLARKGDDGRCRRRVRGGGRLSRERRARDRGGQSKGKAPHVINLSYRWMWVSTRHRARERAKGKLHALSTYHIAGCGCQRGKRQTPRS